MKTVLFIIDPQNDFCDPEGSLYVPNASDDMARIADMIDNYGHRIDNIVITADDHLPNDIAHPRFWADKDGNMPEPFTQISAADIEGNRWMPAEKYLDLSKAYLKALEQKGMTHTIWPMHCVSGTWGADIEGQLMTALMNWTDANSAHYRIVRKGYYPFSEHYGAFEAEVPSDEPTTQYNTALLDLLDQYDRILICGEAKSHCVMNTIRQMMERRPQIMAKVTILADAMQPVTGFEHAADQTIARAMELGAKALTTTEALK